MKLLQSCFGNREIAKVDSCLTSKLLRQRFHPRQIIGLGPTEAEVSQRYWLLPRRVATTLQQQEQDNSHGPCHRVVFPFPSIGGLTRNGHDIPEPSERPHFDECFSETAKM